MKTTSDLKVQNTIRIVLFIIINLSIGSIVKALNFPLYLDSIGTILATLLLGWRAGAITGTVGFILMTVLGFHPFAIFFFGTQIAIALFVHFSARKGGFKTIYRTIVTGILLGIIAAIVSAPVIVYLFKGSTGNGASIVTGFFMKMGNQILESVVLSGVSIEPIDKTIQCVIAFLILKAIPKSLLTPFTKGSLKENGFI